MFIFKVDKLAAGFLAMGLKKGDRIGMWGPNCMEWFLMQYATARAGFIMVIFCFYFLLRKLWCIPFFFPISIGILTA